MRKLSCLAALALLAAAPPAAAPLLVLNHNGFITDEQDTPLTGTFAMTFRIYALAQKPAGTDDTPEWFETYEVPVVHGRYAVSLGLKEGSRKELTVNEFPADTERFLTVQIAGNPEMGPRLRIGIVPWALGAREATHAASADNATNATHAVDAVTATSATSATSATTATTATNAINADDADLLDGEDGTYYTNAAHLSGTLGTGTTFQGAPVADAYVASAAAWNAKLDSIAVAAPLSGDGKASGTAVTLPRAGANADGYLHRDDFNAFAAKLSSETDPQVGANTTSKVPRWDGSALVAGTIFDSGTAIGIGTSTPLAMLDVNGSLHLGTEATCDVARYGSLRWNGTEVQVCSEFAGAPGWSRLGRTGYSQALPGRSCRNIKERGDDGGDALYWIDPNGGATTDAFLAYCDMTNDGGGWTLVYRGVAAGAQTYATLRGVVGAVGTLTAPNQVTNAKLADSVIDLLETQWLKYGANARGRNYDITLTVGARPKEAPHWSQRNSGLSKDGSCFRYNNVGAPVSGAYQDADAHLSCPPAATYNECVGYWSVTPGSRDGDILWGHYCAGWNACNFWENSWPNTVAGNCTDGYIFAK